MDTVMIDMQAMELMQDSEVKGNLAAIMDSEPVKVLTVEQEEQDSGMEEIEDPEILGMEIDKKMDGFGLKAISVKDMSGWVIQKDPEQLTHNITQEIDIAVGNSEEKDQLQLTTIQETEEYILILDIMIFPQIEMMDGVIDGITEEEMANMAEEPEENSMMLTMFIQRIVMIDVIKKYLYLNIFMSKIDNNYEYQFNQAKVLLQY